MSKILDLKKLCLHKWAVGKPIILAISAQQIAMSTRMVCGLLGLLRDGVVKRRLEGLDPSMSDWLNLYRDPFRAPNDMLGWLIPQDDGDNPNVITGKLLRGAINGVRDPVESAMAGFRLASLPYLHKKMLRAAMGDALRFQYEEHLKELISEMKDVPAPDKVDLDAAFTSPEGIFTILVWLPCVLEYGQLPSTLFANARRGDRQAFDQLLLLDKRILGDNQLLEDFTMAGNASSRIRADQVGKAFVELPKYDLSLRKVNDLAAGLISVMSEKIGHPLKPGEIRALFDAAARDREGKSHVIETELPESPEALRQSILRAKPFWETLYGRDKDSLSSRHVDLGLMAVVSDANEPASRPTWLK